MSIDWFEIVAQLINFAILVWLLKRFLYKPVLKAMRDRQDRLNEMQQKAQEKLDEANELVREYLEKKNEIEEERERLLQDARDAASREKEELIESYRQEAKDKREAFLQDVEDERNQFLASFRRLIGESAATLSRGILSEVANRDLHQVFFEEFLSRLTNLEDNFFVEQEPVYRARLISPTVLDAKRRDTLEGALGERLDDLGDIEYVVDEDLVLGYELQFETVTISNHIAGLLAEAETKMQEAMQER